MLKQQTWKLCVSLLIISMLAIECAKSATDDTEKALSRDIHHSLRHGDSNLVVAIVDNLSTTTWSPDLNVSNVTSLYERKIHLESLLGPQRKPMTFVIFMGAIYILIFICGIIGNISTCFVVIFNNCMHTTTNYYLFSLAVSDVLSLLMGLPPELYSIVIEAYPWAFGGTFCLIRTFIFETTTIASVLTILTFTFERWLHICKAIYAKKFSSGFSRALKIIIFIWLLSGLLALPYAFTTGVYYQLPDYVESRTCNILAEHKNLMNRVIQFSVVLLFIVPMTLISIMYVLIGITLWKSQTKHKCYNSTNNSAKSNQSAAGMAAAAVTGERMGAVGRISRFFHRPSAAALNAAANLNGGGVGVGGLGGGVGLTGFCCSGTQAASSSVKRESFTMGSSNNHNGRIKGGKKSKPPKFKFVFPSNSQSSSHESSNASNKLHQQSNMTPSGSKNKINQPNVNEYLLVSQTANGTGSAPNRMTRKLSEFSVGEYSITYGNGAVFQHGQNPHQASERASKEFEHISYRARQSRRDVVKMLFVVVLAFFTCWAPYHSQRFLTTYYEPSSTLMMKIFEYAFYISGIMIYVSSTINPILYNVMSKRYRTAFRNTLKMICSCHCSSKANHHSFMRGSKYYSSINFKAINLPNNDSRRRAQI